MPAIDQTSLGPPAAGPAPAPPSRRPRPRPALLRRPGALVLLGCLALAAISLVGPHRPTYDPTAWLIWGREIVHGDLSTVTGPSWKPFPVLFTTPFALLGDSAAPLLWLVVARAGGLLALVFAFRLARRLAGTPAGVIAVVGLLIANQFAYNFLRGDSEGLLVAASLWAVELALDDRRRAAFWLGAVAALMRPEVWPFLALLGAWVVHGEWRRDGRLPWRTVALVAGGGALVLALWFVPEEIGSGNLLRAASRAREPVQDSPAQAAVPFLAVFTHSVKALSWPVYAGGVLAVLTALDDRRRGAGGRRRLVVAAVATILMLEVAALAQGGFTGNLRYITLPVSLVCVLGGVGWVAAAQRLRAWDAGRPRTVVGVVAAAAVVLLLVQPLKTFDHQIYQVRTESRQLGEVPGVIARAGGRETLLRCGGVATGPFQTQTLAWELRVHESRIAIASQRPGTVLRLAHTHVPGFVDLPRRFVQRSWAVRSTCPLGR